MEWKVELIRNGKRFHDYVHASDFHEARYVALHRNPGSTFLTANTV